jgi:hypothetical protein
VAWRELDFCVLGTLHGLALVIQRLWRDSRRSASAKVHLAGRILGWGATFAFVSTAWVFFRSKDFATAWLLLQKLFWLDTSGVHWTYSPLWMLLPIVILGHWIGKIAERASSKCAFAHRVAPPNRMSRLYGDFGGIFAYRSRPYSGLYPLLPVPSFLGGFFLALWLVILLLFATTDTNPFIYFQF